MKDRTVEKVYKTLKIVVSLLFLVSLISCQTNVTVQNPDDFENITQTSDTTNELITESPISEIVQSTPTLTPTPIENRLGNHIFGIEGKNYFEKISGAGVSWLRIQPQLRWSKIETQKGVYVWDEALNTAIIEANEKGIDVILTIQHSPDWARKYPDRACGPIKEEAFPDFAEFLRIVVQKYSVEPYNVLNFMIWNEPDASISDTTNGNNGNSQYGCWAEDTYPNDPFYGGEYYGRMLKAVYPSMKQANPTINVITGGLLLACDPRLPLGKGYCPNQETARKWNFFEGVIKEGQGSFDLVAFHGYSYHAEGINPVYQERWARDLWSGNGGVVDGKINYLREVMEKYGYEKPIIITESALLFNNETSTPSFEEAKADYLVWTYANTWSQDIKLTTWYSLDGWRFSGLLTEEGEPLPAFLALQTMTGALNDVEFTGRENMDGVTKFIFTSPDKQIWLVVPTGETYGAEYSIATPPNFFRALTIYGQEHVINGEFITFTRPIYIYINN